MPGQQALSSMKGSHAMRGQNFLAVTVAGIVLAAFVGLAGWISVLGHLLVAIIVLVAGTIVAALVLIAIEVADQWERVIVLRLGKYHRLRGPGLFFIVPIIDSVPYWIDMRVITTTFKAEKTLTKDTVPVDVDAVLFWKVVDPEKAALEVAEYRTAMAWAAQTALRDVIGNTDLADMLTGQEKIDMHLQRIIDQRTEPWGGPRVLG